jgi:hypothetical protein
MGNDAQERVEGLLERAASGEEARSFSHFDAEDARRASELADELGVIAARDGVDAAIDRAHQVADEGSLGVAKYALKLYVTHDVETARELTIPSPRISESEPLPPAEASSGEEEGAPG